MSLPPKAAYVVSQGQTRRHHCHWPGCTRQVPPAKWGCRDHWYQLPKTLRDRIWRAYRPGQENGQRPSRDYVAAARSVQDWIAALPAERRVP
jgi:hypothetical protein